MNRHAAQKRGLARSTPLTRSTPLVAKPAVPETKRRKCADCPTVIERITNGPMPKRCVPCARKRENDQAFARRKERGIPASPPWKARRQKPMPSRNEKRRPSGSGSAQRERVVIERAGGRCEFEVLARPPQFRHNEWRPCGSTERVQAVHLARRWKHSAPLAGEGHAVFSDAAAFAGCELHHDMYDRRRPGFETVRVPEEYRLAAFLEIRYAEVKRILANRACVPVDLSELLPCGEHTIDNQYALIDAARKGIAA
jgi:hypothetical protein